MRAYLCILRALDSRNAVLPGDWEFASRGFLTSPYSALSRGPIVLASCTTFASRVGNPTYSALFSSAGPLALSSNMPLLLSSVKYKLRLVLSNTPVTPAPTPASMPTSCARNPSIPPSIPPTHRTSSVSKTLPSTRAPKRSNLCNPFCVGRS